MFIQKLEVKLINYGKKKNRFMSNKYKNIWLIIPLLNDQNQELVAFIDRHMFFLNSGGNILFKVSGFLDKSIASCLNIESRSIILIQKQDSSLYDAWNQSFQYLDGVNIDPNSYIAFLGLDDVLCSRFCDKVVIIISADVDFIYGDIYSRLGERYRKGVPATQPLLFNKETTYVFDVFHPGMMNRWGTISNFKFNSKFQLAADLDFYIRISKSKEINSKYIDTIQSIVGADGVSNAITSKNIYKKEWEIIERDLDVNILTKSIRMIFLTNISGFTMFYRVFRKLYWTLLGRKNINIK